MLMKEIFFLSLPFYLAVVVLIFFVINRNRKKDLLLKVADPDDYVGENIVFYDEEGAGEEDQTAYDISRLQKPLAGDSDSFNMKPMYDDSPPRRDEIPLGRSK